MKQFLRDYYMRYSGPAGMTEQDDMENWNYAHASSRSTVSRRRPYHDKSGLGAGGRHEAAQTAFRHDGHLRLWLSRRPPTRPTYISPRGVRTLACRRNDPRVGRERLRPPQPVAVCEVHGTSNGAVPRL